MKKKLTSMGHGQKSRDVQLRCMYGGNGACFINRARHVLEMIVEEELELPPDSFVTFSRSYRLSYSMNRMSNTTDMSMRPLVSLKVEKQ